MEALMKVDDPELGINIVDLGLVYDVFLNELQKKAVIRMTLTTPACPLLGHLVAEIEEKVKALGFEEVSVDLVWEPPWNPEKMSDRAKMMLGIL
jgi:metal-sulfur cluster biosynthetic enzyme